MDRESDNTVYIEANCRISDEDPFLAKALVDMAVEKFPNTEFVEIYGTDGLVFRVHCK